LENIAVGEGTIDVVVGIEIEAEEVGRGDDVL
jgi:hypothetical protein